MAVEDSLDLVHDAVHPRDERVVWRVRRDIDTVLLKQLVGVAGTAGRQDGTGRRTIRPPVVVILVRSRLITSWQVPHVEAFIRSRRLPS